VTQTAKPANRIRSPLGASGRGPAPLCHPARKARQRLYLRPLHGGCVALVEILPRKLKNGTFWDTSGGGGRVMTPLKPCRDRRSLGGWSRPLNFHSFGSNHSNPESPP
jgi:hypothetical protein